MILLRILICVCWVAAGLTEPGPGSTGSKPASIPPISHTALPAYYSKSLTYQEFQHCAQRKTLGEKPLLRTRVVDFGRHPLRSRLQRFVKIQNPTDSPMFAQLFVMVDGRTIEEVLQRECKVRPSVGDTTLDEEEFANVTSVELPKCSADDEEVKSVAVASREAMPVRDLFTLDWPLADKLKKVWTGDIGDLGEEARVNWLPKQKCGSSCSWVLSDPEHNSHLLESHSQAFFLSPLSQSPQYIPSHSSMLLGPVVFQPSALGVHSGTLIVRNNVTGVEVVELRGETEFGRVAFERETICRRAQHIPATTRYTNLQEMSTLSFEVSKIDITSQQLLHSGIRKLPESIEFTHIYEARNVGNSPLTVTKILVEGVSCSLKGFTVANCLERVSLLPGETMAVNVTYESSFLQNEMTVRLWIVTEFDAFYIPLELSIDMKDMSTLLDQQTVTRRSLTYLCCDLSMLLLSVLAAGYVALIVQESLRDGDLPHASLASKEIKGGRQRVYPRCKSPQLVRAAGFEVNTGEDNADRQLEPPRYQSPTSVKCSAPQSPDLPKPRKVKKQKHPIIKFAPTTVEYSPAPTPELIATTRFLMKNAKQNDSVSPLLARVEHCGEKPRSGSQGSCTTSLDEEEADVYLDEYKTRMGLFGGFSCLDD